MEPLRERIFRAHWFASMASDVGAWMQDVGAPWLLLSLTFTLGLGAAMNNPTWQTIIPELSPRREPPPQFSIFNFRLLHSLVGREASFSR